MLVATYYTIPCILQPTAPVDDLVLAFIKAFLIAAILLAFITLLKSACRSVVAVLRTIVKTLSAILYFLELLLFVLDTYFTKRNLWRLFYGTFVVLFYRLLFDIGAL
jgi:hypothetical protein